MLFISSYLVLSVINKRNDRIYGFLYLLLIAFSQIIFSFEALSLFNAISKNNYLICNLFFLLGSLLIFKKTKAELYIPKIKEELFKIKFALKSDKLLLFCSVCFLLFIILLIINVFFININTGDCLSYYFPRAIKWIEQGSISHFMTHNARELVMPVNFDILYMMHFIFLKTEKYTGIYSFTGYLGAIYVLYMFVKALGFSIRRALWCVLIFSSFSMVLLEAYIPCYELASGFLLISSLFLFFIHVKYDNKISIYFSSLALALAIGVKTIAIISLPALFFLFIVILFVYKSKKIKQTTLLYLLFFTLNFIIFSSYNYILNYIHFKNPVSSEELIILHSFFGGVRGWFCNFLRHLLMLFDTSGLYIDFPSKIAEIFQYKILNFFGYSADDYLSASFPMEYKYMPQLSFYDSVLGICGLFVFIPSLIKAFIKKKFNKKNIITAALSLAFFINLACLSGATVFMKYNNRFMIVFALLSAPVLLYSYSKKTNLYKIIICILIFFCLVLNTGTESLKAIHNGTEKKKINVSEERLIYERMKDMPKGRVALFAKAAHRSPYYFKKLDFKGFRTEQTLLENISEYNLDDYDYIIALQVQTRSNLLLKPADDKLAKEICTYTDKNIKPTDNLDDAVLVFCNVPHEYFARNGFRLLFATPNYVVLKK